MISTLSELTLRTEALHLAVNGDPQIRSLLMGRIVEIMTEQEADEFVGSIDFSAAVVSAHRGRPFVIRPASVAEDPEHKWETIAP